MKFWCGSSSLQKYAIYILQTNNNKSNLLSIDLSTIGLGQRNGIIETTGSCLTPFSRTPTWTQLW